MMASPFIKNESDEYKCSPKENSNNKSALLLARINARSKERATHEQKNNNLSPSLDHKSFSRLVSATSTPLITNNDELHKTSNAVANSVNSSSYKAAVDLGESYVVEKTKKKKKKSGQSIINDESKASIYDESNNVTIIEKENDSVLTEEHFKDISNEKASLNETSDLQKKRKCPTPSSEALNDMVSSSSKKKKKKKAKDEDVVRECDIQESDQLDDNLNCKKQNMIKESFDNDAGLEIESVGNEESSIKANFVQDNCSIDRNCMDIDKKKKKKKKNNLLGDCNETTVNEGDIKPSISEMKSLDINESVQQIKQEADKNTTKRKQNNIKKKKKLRTNKIANNTEVEIGGFTVIGDITAAKKEKVKRVLPHWLANPVIIGQDLVVDGTLVDNVPQLLPILVDCLKKNNIANFFPVQAAIIPEMLQTTNILEARYQPRDICVSAPTGSGKTLAFVLPLLQALHKRVVPRIRALVLLPVQELARQVYNVFLTYAQPLGLRIGLANGQKSFEKEQQSLVNFDYAGSHSLVDIVVATPGRLSDHLTYTKGFTLSSLRFLVLDEADRLLGDQGGEWISGIELAVKKSLPLRPLSLGNVESLNPLNIDAKSRKQYHHPGLACPPLPSHPLQHLLFSATLSHDPELLQHISLYHPKLFTVSDTNNNDKSDDMNDDRIISAFIRPTGLSEEYVIVSTMTKPLVLHHLITSCNWKRTIVFTNSKEVTHKLAIILGSLSADKYVVEEFSANKGKLRARAVSRFSSGKIDVLVSSDAMARGLDFADIDHVVSYEVTSLKTYIHRIGRTSRAGKSGTALSLVTDDQITDFKRICSTSNANVQEINVPISKLEVYETIFIDALSNLKVVLDTEKSKSQTKIEAGNTRRSWQFNNERNNKRKILSTNPVKRLENNFTNKDF